MSVLNLDATEEVEAECYLCRHTNYDYLLQMQDQLGDLSGNKSMYSIMYEAFKRRTNEPLNKEHKDIGFAQFQRHFENHLLSLRACITRDIRDTMNTLNIDAPYTAPDIQKDLDTLASDTVVVVRMYQSINYHQNQVQPQLVTYV